MNFEKIKNLSYNYQRMRLFRHQWMNQSIIVDGDSYELPYLSTVCSMDKSWFN